MTYYDIIKNMDIKAMAVLFTTIISNTEQKFLTKLSDANIYPMISIVCLLNIKLNSIKQY